ncbi:MAG: hypothetical protein FIA95_03665 [Gemmatimonadetes bacterium]|nr:hypothetical protein [Gemmatimonadota bacterium]
MKPALHKVANALEWCGAAVLVVVSFPLIALALFFFRAVVLAAVAFALVAGAVLFCAYSPFRGWVTSHARDPWHAHP